MSYFRTPRFWEQRGLLSDALVPLSRLYAAAVAMHEKLQPAAFDAGVPVICVGNSVAGGAGKTPVAIALVRHLLSRHGAHGHAHFLTRGYGGSERGPLLVQPGSHDAALAAHHASRLAAIPGGFPRAIGSRARMPGMRMKNPMRAFNI